MLYLKDFNNFNVSLLVALRLQKAFCNKGNNSHEGLTRIRKKLSQETVELHGLSKWFQKCTIIGKLVKK